MSTNPSTNPTTNEIELDRMYESGWTVWPHCGYWVRLPRNVIVARVTLNQREV